MIEINNLKIGYDSVLISNIGAELKPGQITAVLGLNGCGKSTFLKTLLNLQKPLGGTITIDGKALTSLNPIERARKISMLRQNPETPNMSVHQLVLHGRFCWTPWPRNYSRQDQKICQEAVKTMGIENLQHKNLRKLSGGERQKAFLAMVLAQQSDYICFDEPGSFMDEPAVQELDHVKSRLKEAGKSIVVIEHDICHALNTCDQFLLFSNSTCFRFNSAQDLVDSKKLEQVFQIKIYKITLNGQSYYQSIPKSSIDES